MGNEPADPHVHDLAIRLARECRRIVQACLREEEWPDADREALRTAFYGLLTIAIGTGALAYSEQWIPSGMASLFASQIQICVSSNSFMSEARPSRTLPKRAIRCPR